MNRWNMLGTHDRNAICIDVFMKHEYGMKHEKELKYEHEYEMQNVMNT